MTTNQQPTHFTCSACGQNRTLSEQMYSIGIPVKVTDAIQKKHPTWSTEDVVCRTCVNEGKADDMQAMLEAEMGALSLPELEVLDSVRRDGLLSTDADDEFEQEQRLGERLAHRFVTIVGSWPFTIAVLMFIASWLVVNLLGRPFSPFPMIVLAGLSAVLASLAGLQGPIILMSQRYQRNSDRLRSKNDYRINLKAELEIQYLTEQIDLVLEHQRTLLTEVRQIRAAMKSQKLSDDGTK